ncbi:ABC transporter substrate-binding protein [Micromonospora sp. NPDC047074]|uniref:ABC transporter substrate-binding protein n=1 Tax=Micromonospora sp. NPDC047074 TaxID=3154339 RepID=UPI0033E6C877
MRRWRYAVLGVVTVAALVGCSTGSGGSNTSAGAGAPGGTIRVGVSSLPPGQGNPFTGIGAQSVYTWSAIFDPLTMVDATGQPQPWLTTSWTNVDQKTWQFKLRENVKFSNGEVFDAAAVKATVDYLASEAGRATVVGAELKMLESATAVDAHTVEIKTNVPEAILPAKLSAMYIVAPKAWADLGPKGFAAAPVGTGPFAVTSVTDERVKATAFKESWRTPQADGLEVIKLAESAARLQALQSKQIDLGIALSPDQIPTIESSGATVQATPAPQVMAFGFFQANGKSPVSDQRVRLALNHAIDRNAIAESLLAGRGRGATQGATKETFGYHEGIEGFKYDPDRARALLAEAGHANGLTLNATVTVGSFPADSEIYQAAADYLAKVGVTLKLETVQFSQWLERYQTSSWTGDMFNQSWNLSPVGDAIRPAMIFSCKKNNPFFCDEKLNPLLDRINSEFDPEKRRGLLHELAEANAANPPSLLLVEQVDLNATSSNTAGYEIQSRFIRYEKLTVQ